MEQQVFDSFRKLIYRESGIHLSERKRTLLSSRIGKRLRRLGIDCEKRYLEIIQTDASGEELRELLEAISTNTTHFYREPKHFEFLTQEIFPRYASGTSALRIWSAASSSGEEPYSIAIAAKEQPQLERTKVRILGTDICTQVLRRAVAGSYPEQQLRELPQDLKLRYFTKVNDEDDIRWKIDPAIQAMVLYRQHNLIKFPWPQGMLFDVIFCRNLMIYFDDRLSEQLVNAFYDRVAEGGYFFVSHSETLSRIKHPFKRISSSIFQKRS